MTRILVLFVSLAACITFSSSAFGSSTNGHDVTVIVQCSYARSSVGSVVGCGASGASTVLRWTWHAATHCACGIIECADCTVCGVCSLTGSTVTTLEHHFENVSSEVGSQSLQLLRNAFSTLSALVSDLWRS